MARMTLLEIFLFSLPFALFFLYRTFILKHRRTDGEAFDPTPYHKLFIMGGVLALSAFIFLALNHKTFREGEYIPAHLENGKVVRGIFVEQEKSELTPDTSTNNEPANTSRPKAD